MEIFSPLHPLRLKRLKRYITHLSGLVAYYPMWEGSGTVCKNYAPANLGSLNGTYTNNTLVQESGKIGRMVSFNGTSSYIDCGTNATLSSGLTACTVISLVKNLSRGSGTQLGPIIAWGDNETVPYPAIFLCNAAVGTNDTNVYLGQNNYQYYDNTYATLSNGNLHSVAFTLPNFSIGGGAPTGAMYIDGTAITPSAVWKRNTGAGATRDQLWIGADDETTPNYLNGKLSHWALYNRELSAAEILRMARISGVA